MVKASSYIVGAKGNDTTILLELINDSNKVLSSYYYELILRMDENHRKSKRPEIISCERVEDIFEYMENKFNTKKLSNYRLDKGVTSFIMSALKMFSYSEDEKDINIKNECLKFDDHRNVKNIDGDILVKPNTDTLVLEKDIVKQARDITKIMEHNDAPVSARYKKNKSAFVAYLKAEGNGKKRL